MKNAISPRKLRLESLEERQLLAVVAGTEQFYDSAATPAATEGKTWVVNTADDPTTWEEEEDGILSLREALSKAESDDRITFLVGTITLSGGELGVGKGITIDGKGVTINANSGNRVFFASDGVELIGLTITGGSVGGIFAYGALTMTGCTVTGNNGTGISASGTLTMTDCEVTGNDGIGISITDSVSSTMTNCRVMRNIGGGIHTRGVLTMTDCEVTGNNTEYSGGGIYVDYGSTLTMTNCTVTGNNANSGDPHYGNGGGICVCYGSTMTMTDCTVEKNTADGGYGGGIYVEILSTLTMINCTVTGNNANSGNGGGIYADGTLTLTNCAITGNNAKGGDYSGLGGGICAANHGPLTLTNCTVTRNTANGNEGGGEGGGIFGFSQEMNLYNTIVAENTGTSSGNDIFSYSDSLYAHNTISSFTDWTSGSSDNLTYDPTKPLFTNAANGVYTLAEFSQAIDKGNDEYIKGYDTDRAGATRIIGDAVDIGAYEYQGPTGGGDGGDGGEGGGDNGEGGDNENETADIIEKIEVANSKAGNHVMSGQEASLTVYLKDEYSEENGYKLKETNWYISDYDGGFICTALQETIYESSNQRTDQLVFTPEKGAHGKKNLTCSIVLEHRNSEGVVDSTLTDEISGTFEIFFDTLGNDGVIGQDPNEDNWLYYWANDGAITGLTLDETGVIHYGDCTVISDLLQADDEQTFAQRSGTNIGISPRALAGKSSVTLGIGHQLAGWFATCCSFNVFAEVYKWGVAAQNIDSVVQTLEHEYQHYLTHSLWNEIPHDNFEKEYAVPFNDRVINFWSGEYGSALNAIGTEAEANYIRNHVDPKWEDKRDREAFVDDWPFYSGDTLTCLADTFGLAMFVSEKYWDYGDNELQSRRAEQGGLTLVNKNRDWSFDGKLSKETAIIQEIRKDKGASQSTLSDLSTTPSSTSNDSSVEEYTESSVFESQIAKGNYLQEAVSENSIEITSETPIDSNNNGYYENLQITANVSVVDKGNYIISWDVFDSENNYIETHMEEIQLESGMTELLLNLSGAKLSYSATGSLSGTFYLFNVDNHIAKYTEYTTESYDYSQFTPYVLLSNFETVTADTNNNGFYDSLTVNFTAELTENSRYLCDVNLTDAEGNIIDNTTITDIEGKGSYDFSVTFDGLKIHQSKVNGPYRLNISFHNVVSYLSEFNGINVYQTPAYSYNDFEGAQASFSGTITENAVDTDGDGRHNTLTISVPVDVAVAGNYSISGYLKDEAGNSIDYDTRTVSLAVGNQTVDLTFDNERIFAAQKNGPYVISSLILSDANYGTLEYLRNPYTTKSYDYTGSEPSGSRFNGEFSDEAVNTHGTELYDALVITIGIDAETSGDYRIVGKLLDENGNLIYEFGQDESLRAGTQNIEVTVPGSAIVAYPGYTGTYRLTGLQILDSDSNLVADGPEYTTAEYSSVDFERASLTLTGDIIDNLDEDGNYLNVSFTAVAVSAGSYSASARILDAEGNEICTAAATPGLEAGTPTEITLRFDYQKIVEHGVGGPFYVKDFSLYKTADAGEYDSLSIPDFHETAAYSFDTNVPEWNLADYDYTNYKLNASSDSNYTAALYGQETDGTWTLLQSWDFIGANAEATITGNSRRVENLTISAGAMESLGKIIFSGGNGHRDAIWIYGTDEDDIFTIDSKVVTTTTPIYVTNPYAELLEHYKTVFGEGSKTYQNIAKCYDKAFEKLSKLVKTTRSTINIVDLEDGATVNFDGVQNAGIFSVGGDDTFRIKALSAAYKLVAGSGTDSLDFSTQKRVVIDMGVSYAQYAVPGQAGSIRLNDDFENLFGTPGNDHVTGSGSGISFSGNGGSDTVILKGGTNTVSLSGKNQSVIATGNGIYTINVQNGDYSCINAAGAGTGAAVNLNAEGRNITLLGGRGKVYADVAGKYATVNASASRYADVAVTGNYAAVLTGAGADQIDVAGDYANVHAGNGDDLITAAGSHSNIFGGNGNDIITVRDNSVSGGENRIYGEAGNDFISAANVSGRNFFYGGIGNDVVVGGSGNDTIYGTSGNNILIGLGGADLIFGAGGRDLLVANRSSYMTGFETMDREQLMGFYEELSEAWIVDDDMEATIDVLGSESLADGVRDKVYRGSGKSNLFYTNGLDNDFENALEKKPFFDTLIDS